MSRGIAMMKAAYIERVGPPENIRFGDLPVPSVGPAEVLVKTTAVCVDPVDTLIRSGQLPEDLPFPFIVGRDLAGVVQAVGPAVRRFAPGARVWCNNQGYDGRQGTFAEYAAVREDLLYPLPPGVDDREAVAFVHSGLTACIGLQEARLQPGESLFLNGGAGNVGSAVLQLARARGARVIATAGNAEGLAWCRDLGADRVVNYRTENVDQALAEFAPEGVPVYWDVSGKPDFDQAVARVARRGRIIVMCGYAARPPFPVGPFYVKRCSLHGFAITFATDAELQACADEINRWLGQGKLKVRIDRVLPLSQAAAAHRLLEDGTPLAGKVVLVP
jgi:NADPH2:quinone reductase